MTRKRVVAIAGTAVLWWTVLGPAIADWRWWDVLTTRVVGSLSIVAVGTVIKGGRLPELVPRLLVLLKNRWVRRGVLAAALLIFLFSHRDDLYWWGTGLQGSASSALREVWYWLEPIFWGEGWDRLALIALALGGSAWLVRRLGWKALAGMAKLVPFLAAIFSFKKWWEMEVPYRISTAVLIALTLIFLLTGARLNLIIVLAILLVVAYRGWPRENPFESRPVDPFELPVFRVTGYLDYGLLLAGYLILLTAGILWFLASGYQLATLVVTFVTAQLYFMWYVHARPGVANAWTTVTISPGAKSIFLNQARGGTGETRLVSLSLGPFGMKEAAGLWDNLLRLFGVYLFEVEPMGFKPQEGETIKKIEFLVQCAHFRLSWEGRVWNGPQALIAYVASL